MTAHGIKPLMCMEFWCGWFDHWGCGKHSTTDAAVCAKDFADLLEQNKLFINETECEWMCLNCGHIHQGMEAPKLCPVCQHQQGYFIRLELAPWGGAAVLGR